MILSFIKDKISSGLSVYQYTIRMSQPVIPRIQNDVTIVNLLVKLRLSEGAEAILKDRMIHTKVWQGAWPNRGGFKGTFCCHCLKTDYTGKWDKCRCEKELDRLQNIRKIILNRLSQCLTDTIPNKDKIDSKVKKGMDNLAFCDNLSGKNGIMYPCRRTSWNGTGKCEDHLIYQ